MCQVYVCTAQDVVLCVGQASLPVSCYGCFVAGVLRRSHTEGQQPPNPKGVDLTQSPHQPLGPTLLGTRAERVPDCSSYSLAFLGVQLTVGCQSTRATPRIAPRGPKPPQARLPALLNVSAADESTTAGGLEAFPHLKAPLEPRGTCPLAGDRFDTACSKFRRNPSPLLSLT